jgi:hypothetical protein
MENFVSLEGPLENIEGKLMLCIPLEAGGDKLAPFAKSISIIENSFLKVEIKQWLANKLNIKEGSFVIVDNKNHKFNITRSSANDEPAN